MMDPLFLILLVVVVLALVGAVPRWPHSAGWGYGPTYLLTIILIIIIIMLFVGRVHLR